MSEFKIDFFELAFLAEACIPPVLIARAFFFDNLSEKYYHIMSTVERKKLFDWISPKLDLSNEDCVHFNCRFNPDNQYVIKTEIEGKVDKRNAYLYNNKYHISKTTSINEQYIKEVIKL